MPQCSSARSLQLHLFFFSGTACDSGPRLDFLSVIIPFQFQAAVPSFFLLPHQSLKSIGSWHLRANGEASPFALNRDEGPEPLTLHMFTLWSGQETACAFPRPGPETGLSVCPLHPVIRGIDFPLRRLNASQTGNLLSQPGQLLKQLGTSVAMTPPTYLGPMGDPSVPELPGAKGLGSLLTPQELHLDTPNRPEGLWASGLRFCLCLPATPGAPCWLPLHVQGTTPLLLAQPLPSQSSAATRRMVTPGSCSLPGATLSPPRQFPALVQNVSTRKPSASPKANHLD